MVSNPANTPARWQAALRWALAEGVAVRQLAGCAMWIAPSARDATMAYEVTPWEGECAAGESGNPVCKHHAALRVRLGWLKVPTPTVETPCHNCGGDGTVRAENFAGRL